MNQLSLREKLLLLAAVLFLSGYVFYAYLYLPLQREVTVMASRNRRLEKELVRVRAWEGKEDHLRQVVGQLVAQDRANAVRVPHLPGQAELLVTLGRLARDNHLNLRVLEQQDREDRGKEPFASFVLKGEVTGSYHDLWVFLRGLERLPRLLSVERVTIESVRRKAAPPPVAAVKAIPGASRVVAEPETGWSPEVNRRCSWEYDGSILTCRFTLLTYYDQSPAGPGGTGLTPAIVPETTGVADPFVK